MKFSLILLFKSFTYFFIIYSFRKSSTPLQSPIKSVETPKRKPKNLNINTNIENTSNNTNSNTNSNEPTENDSTSDPTDTTSTSSSSITNLPTPPSISSPDKNLKKFGLNNINNDNSLTSEEILCLDSPKREEISKNLLLFSPISSSSAPSFREKHSNSFLVNNGLLADKPEFSFPISTSNITPSKLPSSPSNSSRSSSSASIASLNPTLEKIYNTVSLIQWDLPRTYPTLGFFHDGGLMHVGLERILLCYSLYCPEIGYVQGMSFLVGNLLLYLNEYNSFKLFINILNKKIINNFYSLKKNYIDSYVLCFNYFFKKILPLLYNYLQQEDISSEMFLIDWNLSLFTKSLPLEVAAYIWDIYFLEGEITLLIVSLSLLKLYGSYISTLKMEDILSFLLHLPENINQDELKENINSIRLLISKKLYNKIRAEKINEVNKKLNENMSSYHSSSVSSVAGSTLSISPYSTTSSISSPSTYISSLSASLFPNICSVCQVDIVNCICNENTSDLRKKTHSIVSVSGASIISTSATSSSSSSSSAAILSLSTPSNTSSSSNGSNKNGISPIDDFSSVTSTPSSTPNEPKKKKSQSESSCIPS